MNEAMFVWLSHPHAAYVVAAYAVAACGLIGLGALSLARFRRLRALAQKLAQGSAPSDAEAP